MFLNFLDLNNTKEKERKAFADELMQTLKEVSYKLDKLEDFNLDTIAQKYREEGAIYYVMDRNPEKVYLTKSGVNKVFIENKFPNDLRNQISEGMIVRYKNGTYEIDRELTEKNFEGLLDFDNYMNNK